MLEVSTHNHTLVLIIQPQPPVQPDEPLVLQEATTGSCNVDGLVESEQAGFAGSGYANNDNLYGTGSDWAVNAESAGNRDLIVRFANGASDRAASLYINGQWASEVNFPGIGEWSGYEESGAVSADLNAGKNRVSLRATSSAPRPRAGGAP